MTEQLGPFLGQLASAVAAVATLRGLTFCAWALASRRFRPSSKGLVVLVYASLGVLAASTDPQFFTVLGFVALGFVYFTAAAALLSLAAARRWFRSWPRWALAVFAVSVFLVVPAVGPRMPGGAAILLAGWELMFAAYSYAVETARRPGEHPVADGLFFLLVNPTLSYPERGKWMDGEYLGDVGVRRCAVGALLLLAHFVVLRILSGVSGETGDLTSIRSAADYASFVGVNGLRIVRVYLVQAGVATIHLGLLCIMGFKAPERFDRPWLATGPADFWRRWNTYVGVWFRRYVFTPLSYAAARRRWLPSAPRTALSVMGTFLVAGLSHDIVWLLQSGRAGVGAVSFAIQGVALVVFAAVPDLAGSSVRQRFVRSACLLVCWWHVLLVTAWMLAPRGA